MFVIIWILYLRLTFIKSIDENENMKNKQAQTRKMGGFLTYEFGRQYCIKHFALKPNRAHNFFTGYLVWNPPPKNRTKFLAKNGTAGNYHFKPFFNV